MPEPVSAATTWATIHTLTRGLLDNIKDRKFAAEVREIQKLIFTVETEHFALRERNLELVSDNAELTKALAALKAEVAKTNEQRPYTSEETRIHRGTKFKRSAETGWVWQAFCPVCNFPARECMPHIGMICARAPACLWKSGFLAEKLSEVLNELPAERTA